MHISDTEILLRDLVHENRWSLDRLYMMLPAEVHQWLLEVTPKIEAYREDG